VEREARVSLVSAVVVFVVGLVSGVVVGWVAGLAALVALLLVAVTRGRLGYDDRSTVGSATAPAHAS
jgi:hypothetical protein